MVMKFRMVKFARIPSYNQLFSGDPVWATLEVAGMGQDGRSMVTKNDYRLKFSPSKRKIYKSIEKGVLCLQDAFLCAEKKLPKKGRCHEVTEVFSPWNTD